MNHILYIFTSSQSAYYFMSGQFDFLIKKGFQITILLPDDGFFSQVKDKNKKCDVQIIPIVRKIDIFNDVKTLFVLVKKIWDINPDIIHLHTPKAGLLGGLASKILFKKNVVFHLHGLVSVNGNKMQKGLTFYLEKLSLILADKVISVSPSLMNFCIDNNLVSPDKIEVFENGTINGVDFNDKFNFSKYDERVNNLRSEFNLQNKFIIGFLGRVNKDKGINDVISVYQNLSLIYSNLALFIVGPNELQIPVIELFKGINQSNVHVIDRVDNPEIFLKLFDLQLFPSKREGFGLALVEASALGTPSVAYDIFGIRDAVLNNKTGTLVKFGDQVALTKAIQNYVENPNILHSHSYSGVNYVKENFSRLNIWNAQYAFYLRLLDK